MTTGKGKSKTGNEKIEQAVDEMYELASGRQRNVMDDLSRSRRGELFVLKYIAQKNAEVTPSEISDAMQTSTARVSAALNALEKKGQIHREIDRTNRRNILVTITDAGRERIDAVARQMRQQMVDALVEMGEQDAIEFVRLSKRFMEISQRVFRKGSSC